MTTGFAFCATCGTPRDAADQKFCAGCGSALPPAAPSPPRVPPAPVASPPSPVAPAAWSMPLAPQYPPTYLGGPPPAYTGSPTYAAPGSQAATGTSTGILRRVLMIPVTLVTHLLGRVLMTVATMLIIGAVATSWLGVVQVPILSSAFGMDHPRDLHMVKDSDALDAFCSKWGIERPSPTANYTLSGKHHYSGTVQVDDTISEAALAALPEYSAPNASISQMQFRIHEGSIEMSAFVHVPGYPASGPVYAQFSIAATSSRTVALTFSQLDFGRIGVPSSVINAVKTTLDEYLNGKILAAGVTIDTLELHEGAIRFKGTWPKTIAADPPKPAGVP
jgi:hypothetical protein